MKNTRLVLLTLAAAAAFAAPVQAQLPNVTPFSLEVRGGLALPTGDFGDGDVESGITYGANATFHFIPLLGIYGGYTRNEFGGEDDADLTDEGFSGGLRLAIPTPLIPIDPYVKAGVVYNTLEISGSEGGVTVGAESDRSLGFEVGAGIGIGLGPKLSLTPQVTYTKYSPDFGENGLGDIVPDVSHIRVDVGLRLRL
jgi:hypothetical protein